MPTTFDVIYLGVVASIDVNEGDNLAENVSSLLGNTYGSAGAPLAGSLMTLSMVGNVGSEYRTDNNLFADQFSVDGTTYTFDAIAVLSSTVVFTDGSSITYNIRIAQTTTGELFILPNPDGGEAEQELLNTKAIESVTFNSVLANDAVMTASRVDNGFTNEVVDGTDGADEMRLGYIDEHGDRIDASDNVIEGGGGNDTIEGSGGGDTIDGGSGDDLIYGDTANGAVYGTLNPTNTDNLQDGGGTETWANPRGRAGRAVERQADHDLVRAVGGDRRACQLPGRQRSDLGQLWPDCWRADQHRDRGGPRQWFPQYRGDGGDHAQQRRDLCVYC